MVGNRKTALDNNDIETLKNKMDELEKAAAYMAGQAGNNPQPDENAGNNGNDDDVVDADFHKKD